MSLFRSTAQLRVAAVLRGEPEDDLFPVAGRILSKRAALDSSAFPDIHLALGCAGDSRVHLYPLDAGCTMGADQQLSVDRLWRDGAAVAGATRPCDGFGAGGVYLEMVAVLDADFPGGPYRTDERRVGQEWVRTCSTGR